MHKMVPSKQGSQASTCCPWPAWSSHMPY